MKVAVPFCPACGKPTSHATAEQKMQWELATWHAHKNGSSEEVFVASNGHGSQTVGTVITRPSAGSRDAAVSSPHRAKASKTRVQRDRRPRKGGSRSGLIARWRARNDEFRRHNETLDGTSPFIHFACMRCEGTKWLLRTGRNEDGSWKYWCVRCSNSFKSDAWLEHGRYPFIVAGTIFAAILVLTYLP
ncbi:MAG: hypothetical protein ABR548_08780 [Actinomycetota bacterium]|nr:hypothetical protein [Actinomycetota bacterium]